MLSLQLVDTDHKPTLTFTFINPPKSLPLPLHRVQTFFPFFFLFFFFFFFFLLMKKRYQVKGV